MGNRRGAMALLVVAAIITGCSALPGRPQNGMDGAAKSLVWPMPPLQPRIRFVQTVSRPQDLGIRPSFLSQIGEFFAGRDRMRFIRPSGVTASGSLIYVADPGAQSLWVLDTGKGKFQRIQTVGHSHLVSPIGVTPGAGDRVYLTDSGLKKAFIFKGTDGSLVKEIDNGEMQRPTGIAYDLKKDRLYIADSAAHRIHIFSGEGLPLGSLGRRGDGDGEFNYPTHLAVDRDGTLFVIDSLGFRVQFFTAEGRFLGQFGVQGDTSGDFASPKGVAIDSAGHVYVVDALFDAVQIFDRQGQFLLSFGDRGLGPGQFWLPGGISIGAKDRIFVADAYNQRVQIFEYLADRRNE